MKRFLAVNLLIVLLLSGCLYPQSELSKNQLPNEEQLKMIESAVIQYKEENKGLVPIKTTTNDVAIYEKYIVDFTTLLENRLINEIPATAYENGGYYQYVILSPEENPKVKLIDLRVTEKIREINVKIDIYRQKNLYPPFGELVAPGIYEINYEKIGLKERPEVISPYSNQALPLLITTDGEIIVDYRLDLQMAIEELKIRPEKGKDIRYILEENYPFVPAYSLAYNYKDGLPVFEGE